VPDLIETRKTGLLVAPGDVAGLAAQMRMVLQDTVLAIALGHNARRAARARFHPQAVAARTRAVYERLAGSA
jgi:glycosyltransferase involved in cell wall biosynthesis